MQNVSVSARSGDGIKTIVLQSLGSTIDDSARQRKPNSNVAETQRQRYLYWKDRPKLVLL